MAPGQVCRVGTGGGYFDGRAGRLIDGPYVVCYYSPKWGIVKIKK